MRLQTRLVPPLRGRGALTARTCAVQVLNIIVNARAMPPIALVTLTLSKRCAHTF